MHGGSCVHCPVCTFPKNRQKCFTIRDLELKLHDAVLVMSVFESCYPSVLGRSHVSVNVRGAGGNTSSTTGRIVDVDSELLLLVLGLDQSLSGEHVVGT